MNNLIKELAEQSGITDDKFGMFFAKEKHCEDGVDLGKFAELIVRECAYWIEFGQDERGDRIGDSLYWSGVMKKHFGIE